MSARVLLARLWLRGRRRVTCACHLAARGRIALTLLPDSPKPTYSAILKRIARWVERLPRAAGLAGWPGTEFRQLRVSSMAIVGYGTSVGSSPLRLRTAGDGSFTNDPSVGRGVEISVEVVNSTSRTPRDAPHTTPADARNPPSPPLCPHYCTVPALLYFTLPHTPCVPSWSWSRPRR